MNGGNGFNTRIQFGVSRDMVLAASARLNSGFILVQDDPDTIMTAKNMGMHVIYRQSGDETLEGDKAAFLNERLNKGAEITHLTNELEPTPKLHELTRWWMEEATRRKRIVVAYNLATHKSKAQWASCYDNLCYARDNGHWIGVHMYLDMYNDATAYEWLEMKHKVGGRWMFTEFGLIKDYRDPYHGWRGYVNEGEMVTRMSHGMQVAVEENMPVLHFSYEQWPHSQEGINSGCGLLDAAWYLDWLTRVNKTFIPTIKPDHPIDAIDISSNNGVIRFDELDIKYVYIRSTMGKAGIDVKYGENAHAAEAAGKPYGLYHLLRPEHSGKDQADFFLKTTEGLRGTLPMAVDVELMNGLTSQQVYDFLEIVGPDAVIYTSASKFNQLDRTHDNDFAKHKLWVAHYGADFPALPRQWKDYWLWQYGQGKVKGVDGDVDLNQLKGSIPMPVPDRESLGTPIEGYVKDVPQEYVNVRNVPATTGAIVGQLREGDKITYRPTKTQKIDGYQWWALEKPWIAWTSDLMTPAPLSMEEPTLKRYMPYVSQRDSNADHSFNDCGVACVAMIDRWYDMQNGKSEPSIPIVDELIMHTPLGADPKKLMKISDMLALANKRGFAKAKSITALSIANLKAAVQTQPVICLLKYKYFNPPDAFDGPHFAVCYDFSTNYFWFNDPYNGGDGWMISSTQLDEAMKRTTEDGNMSYQGVLLI